MNYKFTNTVKVFHKICFHIFLITGMTVNLFGAIDGPVPIDLSSNSTADLTESIAINEGSSDKLNVTIEGKVLDENGEPLPGATILEKGTTNGTTTNVEGNFKLDCSENAVLVVSFVGYIKQEIKVSNQTFFEIQLTPDSEQLDDVVVIGYGTVKKSDLTGSVSSVDSEELVQTPTPRIDDALRGKVAGLQITPTSSQPGAAATIRIRGSNSIQANNEPLLVVDGFIGGINLNDINLNDVESIEVLKDASATAIYGSRGSNGVILITTKRGKKGTMRVNYDGFVGWQSATRFLDMMNAAQFGEFANEVKNQTIYADPAALGQGTDWQREIYGGSAPMTSHTVSVSGGNAISNFYVSANYFNQEGLSINSGLKRYQTKVNSDHSIGKKLKIGESLLISRTERTPGYHGTDAIQVAGWDPTVPVRDANGDYAIQIASSELSNDNPVARARQLQDLTTETRIIGNLYAEYEILEGLKVKTSFGANLNQSTRKRYTPSSLFEESSNGGTAQLSDVNGLDILFENTLSYNKSVGDHSISGVFGYTRQTIDNFTSDQTSRGFVTDAFGYNNMGAGVERLNIDTDLTEQGLESYLFRANYSFKGRYLITASARYDGASVFAANNKWAFFPSMALAWRLGDETFIQSLGVFDDLKLRASVGRLGNPGVAPGESLSRLSDNGNSYILGTNEGIVSGIAPNSLGNADLKWETTEQFDIGMDMAFFKNRLQVSLDYYSKLTTDLLVNRPVLWLTGFETALSNFGSVSNKGFELALSSVNIDNNGFKWETSFNIATNKNNIEAIEAPEGFVLINGVGTAIDFPTSILREGVAIGTFHGLVMNGIWNDQAEIDAAGVSGPSVFPGGRRYEDINNDGVIDITEDRTIIGDSNPEFFGGLGNTLSYKGFELYTFFSFVYGNDIYNETDATIGVAFDNNVPVRYVNRWTPENTDTNIPSSDGIVRPLITSNTGAIEDGSFLRLRNISLAYNLPVQDLDWIQRAKVYVNGTNLLLFDRYSGYDPEINRSLTNTRRGYDNASDPNTKMITVGLNVSF